MLNKKFLVTMAAVGICSALIGCAASKNSSETAEAHTYPWAGVVVNLDNQNDLVTISTASGLEYEFYGISDLCEGDIVAVTMDDNGTPDMVLDDKIIDAKYAGCPEQLENQNPESTMVDMSRVIDISTGDGNAYLQMEDGTGYYWEN